MTTISASSGAAPPRENLVRALAEAPTLIRTEGAAMPTLTGHFAVWDQWTEINSAFEGHFLERFAPTSMTKTMSESKSQMRVLFQHGKDPQIGDKVLGPIERLEPDAKGAAYEVPLLDTSYNRDLIPGLDAGLYGASFRFQVISEEFQNKPKPSDYNPSGLPERTVLEARVREFGPVTFPAYAGATAGLRSMTDEFIFGALLDDPERLRALIAEEVAKQHFTISFPIVTSTSSTSSGEFRAVWSTAYVNNLPDSAFLHIESGGSKDSEGKTVPRSLRHFPYKDASGNIDLPHLRNALSRIPQSSLPASVKEAASAKAQRILAEQQSTNSESDLSGETTLEGFGPGPPAAATPTEPGTTEPEPSGAATHFPPRFKSREEWLQWIIKT